MEFGTLAFFFAVLSAISYNTEDTVCYTGSVCGSGEINGQTRPFQDTVTACTTNSDCGSDECCYIKPAFEIVSRRRQASILPVQPAQHHKGICESYRVQHEQCGPLEQANGHCGCGAGMSCQFVPAEVATVKPLVVSKKRKIYVPGPGTFQCENTS